MDPFPQWCSDVLSSYLNGDLIFIPIWPFCPRDPRAHMPDRESASHLSYPLCLAQCCDTQQTYTNFQLSEYIHNSKFELNSPLVIRDSTTRSHMCDFIKMCMRTSICKTKEAPIIQVYKNLPQNGTSSCFYDDNLDLQKGFNSFFKSSLLVSKMSV